MTLCANCGFGECLDYLLDDDTVQTDCSNAGCELSVVYRANAFDWKAEKFHADWCSVLEDF